MWLDRGRGWLDRGGLVCCAEELQLIPKGVRNMMSPGVSVEGSVDIYHLEEGSNPDPHPS